MEWSFRYTNHKLSEIFPHILTSSRNFSGSQWQTWRGDFSGLGKEKVNLPFYSYEIYLPTDSYETRVPQRLGEFMAEWGAPLLSRDHSNLYSLDIGIFYLVFIPWYLFTEVYLFDFASEKTIFKKVYRVLQGWGNPNKIWTPKSSKFSFLKTSYITDGLGPVLVRNDQSLPR